MKVYPTEHLPLFQIYTPPELDSTREDLQYYEHEVDPKDDWMVKTKKEWSDLLRVPSNPLDLAVLRLTNLERNVERRYLKEPLWNLAEVVRLAPLTPPPGGEEVPLDAVRWVRVEGRYLFFLPSNITSLLSHVIIFFSLHQNESLFQAIRYIICALDISNMCLFVFIAWKVRSHPG